jgi:hypothetical protein
LIISRIPGVDDQFFCSLKSLPYLKNLIVYEIRQFSDLGIKALNEAPFNLHEALFHGENCTVSEDGFIDFIKKSLNIQKLSFHLDCNLSDRFLKAVGDHSLSLNSLYCFYSDKITDDGIEYVVKNCTFLKHLALGNCKLLTDQSLHSITEHRPELENLYIRNAHQITIGGLSKLGNKCTQLTVLDIHGTKISEKDFCSLPELFPLLVSLEVSRSINFTIDALKMIVENCKNLNTLFHSIYISNSDLEMFRTQYPKVKLEYAVD